MSKATFDITVKYRFTRGLEGNVERERVTLSNAGPRVEELGGSMSAAAGIRGGADALTGDGAVGREAGADLAGAETRQLLAVFFVGERVDDTLHRAGEARHRLAVAYRETSGAIVVELTQGEIFAARMRLSEGSHGR